MTRVKKGQNKSRRHKKVLKKTKGYRGLRSSVYSQAKQAWMKAGLHAYTGRKLKKRNYRQLWITRINAALRQIDPSYKYSRFIRSAEDKKMEVNRKMLADLAVNHPSVFEEIAKNVNN